MCSVELKQGVDVPVHLSIDLSGPGNWSTNDLLIHKTTLTATVSATITSFASSQSGNYICIATIHSTSSFFIGFGSLAGFAEVGKSLY